LRWTLVCSFAGSGDAAIVKRLLSLPIMAKSYIDVQDSRGLGPLHIAASHGRENILTCCDISRRIGRQSNQDIFRVMIPCVFNKVTRTIQKRIKTNYDE
jgi:ankyrin repeat protein